MAAQKNKFLIAAGVIFVVGAVGWTWAGYQATQVAKDRIDGFLIRNNLANDIRYQDLSASPFGTATLKGVTVMASSTNPVTIGSLEVSDLEMKGDQLRGIRVSAQKAEIPVLELARQQRNPEKMLRDAIGLGYAKMSGGASVAFRYDDQRGTLSVDTTGDLNDVGAWEAHVVVGGISVAAVNDLYALSASVPQLGGFALLGALGQAEETLARTVLVEMEVGIDNGGWFKRSSQIPDQDLPFEGEISAGIDETQLVHAGMAPSEALSMRQTLDGWVRKGGTLRVTSNLAQPLPLFRGSLLAPNFDSVPRFLVAAKARVTN